MEVLYFFALLFSNLASHTPPLEAHSFKAGEVNQETIKQAEEILGVRFQENPAKLHFYSSKPNEIGGYFAFLKADISQKEFERIVGELNLQPRPGRAWLFSPPKTEEWWDTTSREKVLIYSSDLKGEDPTYYAHYKNGAIYFYKHFQNYSQY